MPRGTGPRSAWHLAAAQGARLRGGRAVRGTGAVAAECKPEWGGELEETGGGEAGHIRHPDSMMASVAVGLCWACGAARAGDTRRPAGKGAGRPTVPPYGGAAQKLERNGMLDRVPGRTIRPVPGRGKSWQRGRADPRGTGRSRGGPSRCASCACRTLA